MDATSEVSRSSLGIAAHDSGESCDEEDEEALPDISLPNPALIRFIQERQCADAFEASLCEAEVVGWYLLTLHNESGVEDFPERVEALCVRLWKMGGDNCCSVETRTCLHDPRSGLNVPDAMIFQEVKSTGTWILETTNRDPAVVCRLQDPGGGTRCVSHRALSLSDLSSAAWFPTHPADALEAHWSRWPSAEDPF